MQTRSWGAGGVRWDGLQQGGYRTRSSGHLGGKHRLRIDTERTIDVL